MHLAVELVFPLQLVNLVVVLAGPDGEIIPAGEPWRVLPHVASEVLLALGTMQQPRDGL